MQPLDPQGPNDSGSAPQPPQVPQSPYSAPQSPYNAPQPPTPPGQSPYGGPGQPPPYGGPQQFGGGGPMQIPGADKKMSAALCGIFLGGFGVHKFVLGYNTEGFIMLAASVFTCGVGYPLVHLIGLIEGIVYMTKTDEQFVNEYITGKKPWF